MKPTHKDMVVFTAVALLVISGLMGLNTLLQAF